VYEDPEEPTFTVTLSPKPLTGQWVLAALLKQYFLDPGGVTVSGKLLKGFHEEALAQLCVGRISAY
jgi:hypothetical protein